MKADVDRLLSVPPRVPDVTATTSVGGMTSYAPLRTSAAVARLAVARGQTADVVGQPWRSVPQMFDEADEDGLVSGVKFVYFPPNGFGRPNRLLRRPRTAFVGGIGTAVFTALQSLLDAGYDADIAPLGAAVVLAGDTSIAAAEFPILSPVLASDSTVSLLGSRLAYAPSAERAYGGDVLIVIVREDQLADDVPANNYTRPGTVTDDGTDPDPPAPPAGFVQLTSSARPVGIGNSYAFLDIDAPTAAAHVAAVNGQLGNFARLRNVFFVLDDASGPVAGNFPFDDVWAALVAGDPQYELQRYTGGAEAAAAQAIYDLIVAHFS